MGGSIYIHGTASSIVDTVFVCRDQGYAPRQWLFESAEGLAAIIARDLAQLSDAGCRPTRGDTHCIVFGHLTRMAVWNLRKGWDPRVPTAEKLERFAEALTRETIRLVEVRLTINYTSPAGIARPRTGPTPGAGKVGYDAALGRSQYCPEVAPVYHWTE